MLEIGREGLGACRRFMVIIFPSPTEATASPSLVMDAQRRGEGQGLRGFEGSEARPRLGKELPQWLYQFTFLPTERSTFKERHTCECAEQGETLG